MNIVCAQSVLFGYEAFSTIGEVAVLPDREIAAADLRAADALVIRSKTRVHRPLLQDTPVRYAGTATAGFDHFDLDYLEQAGVTWYAARGCNANSVAEYVVAGLLHLAQQHGFTLAGKTLGVIGVGQIGSRVVRKAEALGLCVLQNDPPRREAEAAPELLPLEDILPRLDIVTLHVPLTDAGPFATRGMVGRRFLQALKPGAIFINASRGEVVDEAALMESLDRGHVEHAILDVWNHEPQWSSSLAERVEIGTPHIAGYSFDGLLNGTLQVYRDLCRFEGCDPRWNPDDLVRPPSPAEFHIDARGRTDEAALYEAVRAAYDIVRDDRDLRGDAPAGEADRARRFERLRKEYPVRREFMNYRLHLPGATSGLIRKAGGLGFHVGGESPLP